MSSENTPLLGQNKRLHDEPSHLHGECQHIPHHHHNNYHSTGHIKPDDQESIICVEAGERRFESVLNHDSTNDAHNHQTTSDPYEYLGFSFAILAGICFTSSNVMVKYLKNVSSWELLFIRCFIQSISMLPLVIILKHNILGPPDFITRFRVFAQGGLGGILLLCIFKAVADLPLGDATAIFFSSPAFTMLLSTCILRDHCGIFRMLVAICLLAGVIILSRPPSLFPPPEFHHRNGSSSSSNTSQHDPYVGEYHPIGLLSGVAVPILSAFIVIITRQAKHVHYSVLVFWFAIGGLIVSIIGMEYFDGDQQGSVFNKFLTWKEDQWVLTFLIALVGLIGSILMTKAVCWVTPSKVMVVRSFEVVVAYILQVTVFDTPTYLSDVFGTMLVILSVLSMGIEDHLMTKFSFKYL